MLHHPARSERLYAAALDEALPDADPTLRYEEACRRLDEMVPVGRGRARDPSVVFPGLYGIIHTPDEVVDLVLIMEGELLAGARVEVPAG